MIIFKLKTVIHQNIPERQIFFFFNSWAGTTHRLIPMMMATHTWAPSASLPPERQIFKAGKYNQKDYYQEYIKNF